MKIKIAWLYYDLLELYGDRGNIKVIEEILKFNNIQYETDLITINDNIDISNHDILFLGGGSDSAMKILSEDLFKRKEQIKNIMKNKGYILCICGGYQMLGKYYLNGANKKIQGLGIFDYYTEAGQNRSVGNIKTKVNIKDFLENYEIVGFENHGGETKNIKDNYLGEVIEGNGNEYKSKYEGYYSHNFIGTYIHGPLLPKNPEIAKAIIEQILFEKYNVEHKLNIPFEEVVKQARKEIKY